MFEVVEPGPFQGLGERALIAVSRVRSSSVSRRGWSKATTHTPKVKPDAVSGRNAQDCFPEGASSSALWGAYSRCSCGVEKNTGSPEVIVFQAGLHGLLRRPSTRARNSSP